MENCRKLSFDNRQKSISVSERERKMMCRSFSNTNICICTLIAEISMIQVDKDTNVEILKIWTPEIFAVITLNFEQVGFTED